MAVKKLKITTDNILTLQNELDIHKELQHNNIIKYVSSEPTILEPNEELHIFMECIPGGNCYKITAVINYWKIDKDKG